MTPGTTEATVRTFGPGSPETLRLAARVHRVWRPIADNWRMTPRGIRMLQRLTDPIERVPTVRGTAMARSSVGGVPVELVRGPRALEQAFGDAEGPSGHVEGPRADEPVLLYLHGGGYVFGSPRTHRGLVSRLSHATGLPAVVPDYRLPPEWTLPAPVEDALAVYRVLLEDRDASRIVVMGDSAGGNLAHALLLHAAEAGLPMPSALVLLSPWSDLTMSGDAIRENGDADPFIPVKGLVRCARVAAGGADPADWRCSPLFAPDELQRALPPTLIQVGAGESLRDDGVRVGHRLAALGVRAEVEIYEGAMHVVPVWSGTPEARDAIGRIVTFVASALPAGVGPAPDAEAADEAAEPDHDPTTFAPPGAPGHAP